MAKKTEKKIENDVQNSLPGELTEEELIDLLNAVEFMDESTDPFLIYSGVSEYQLRKLRNNFKEIITKKNKKVKRKTTP